MIAFWLLHSTYPPRNKAHTQHAGLYPVDSFSMHLIMFKNKIVLLLSNCFYRLSLAPHLWSNHNLTQKSVCSFKSLKFSFIVTVLRSCLNNDFALVFYVCDGCYGSNIYKTVDASFFSFLRYHRTRRLHNQTSVVQLQKYQNTFFLVFFDSPQIVRNVVALTHF